MLLIFVIDYGFFVKAISACVFIVCHVCIVNRDPGRRGRDRMVVGFTTTYAFSAYRH